MKNILQNIFLFFAVFLFNWGYGQQQIGCNIPKTWTTNNFPTGLTTVSSTYLGVNQFSNLGNLTDTNLTNSSNWNSVVLNPEAELEISNNQTFPAGTYAGFVLTDYLGAALGTTYTIETLMNNTIVNSEEITISLQALTTQYRNIGVFSTGSFNKIRLKISTVGISTFRVFNAYTIEPCTTLQEFSCDDNEISNKYVGLTQDKFAAVIDAGSTGIEGANPLTVFGNPDYVVDDNPNTSTTIFIPLGIASTAKLGVKLLNQEISSPSEPYFAGFEFETSSIVDINAFKNIEIEAWNDDEFVKSSSDDGNIASVGLFGEGSKGVVGIIVDEPFNRLIFKYTSLLDVSLGTMNIHRAVVKKFCESPDLSCNTPTIIDNNIHPVSIGSETGTTGISIGGLSNTDHLIDGDENTYTSINSPLGVLSTTTISVDKVLSPFPKGSYVSFDVEFTSLLDVNVLPEFSIVLLNNGMEVGRDSGQNFLLGANIATSTRKTLGYLAPAEFNEIQLIYKQPVGISVGTIKVYDLKINRTCQNPIDCTDSDIVNTADRPVVINQFRTGPEGIACALCSVENAQNLITPDGTDYATLNMSVGLGGTVGISAQDLTNIYPSGTYVGFTIEDVPYLLQADVLEGFFVKTYLNGEFQETANDASLLDLSVILSIGTGTKNYGFRATKPFNEVKFEVFSLVSAFNSIKVYNLRIDASNPTANDGNINCINGICVKPGNTNAPGLPTLSGISTLQNTRNTWPNDIPNGFIALESKNKGMVISRVANTNAIETPLEGMLIYDVSANCVKLYNGTVWKCLEQSCNE